MSNTRNTYRIAHDASVDLAVLDLTWTAWFTTITFWTLSTVHVRQSGEKSIASLTSRPGKPTVPGDPDMPLGPGGPWRRTQRNMNEETAMQEDAYHGTGKARITG